ncbi:MAG: HPP family protein [Mariprofundus sp.]
MIAANIMVTDVIAVHVDDSIGDVLARMRQAKLRMVPVLNDERIVVGVISTYTIIEQIVPSYIVSGDLDQIPYAPDIGLLQQHYHEAACKKVVDIMDRKPLTVHEDESILSVAAALVVFTRHEYAMVIDKEGHLKGILSAGDILDRLRIMESGHA